VKSEEAVVAVIDALDTLRIPYMLVGSLSQNVYGVPRSTQDADIVLQIDPGALGRLKSALGMFLWEPQLSFEAVTGTTRQILEAPGTGFKIELFLLTDDPHDQERFERRKRVTVFGRQTSVATAEDVVITKLRWSKQGQRRKDLEDVRGVVAVSDQLLDWPYIHHWCDAHGTRQLLEEVRRSVPPA
jgi:hypothetical protein